MPKTITLSDIIAFIALALSIFATWKTVKFNKRQESLIDSQEKLNNVMLEKSDKEAISEKRADIGVKFITIGRNKERLKIWNQGEASARNVRIEFPEGNDIIIHSEILEKFPLEVLRRHESVELVAAVTSGAKRKHIVQIIWDDDYSTNNEQVFYPII